MMKGMVKFLGIVFALLLALSVASAVSVSGAYSASLCQCETVKQIYSVCTDTTGVYSVSTSGQASNWISIAPSVLSIEAGKCSEFYVFITPECYANSGTYSPQLIVDGPEDSNNAITLNVTQCHTFDFSVTPLISVSNPCVENVFEVYAKNTGKFKDEYLLSQYNLPQGWANYSQERIILNAGEELRTQLKVKSTCNALKGDYNFSLSMANTRTNVSHSEPLVQRINSFKPFSLSGLFSDGSYFKAETCEEFDKNILFTATNLSDKNDEITLYLLDANLNALSKDVAYFDKEKFTLNVNEPVSVSFIIKKNSPKTLPVVLRAYSKSYDTTFEANMDIVYSNCYDLNIVKVSEASSSCLGNATIALQLTNNGTRETDVNVSLKEGLVVLQTKAVLIPSNSTIPISFDLNSTTVSQKQYLVTAASTFSSSDANFAFAFENCFDASLSVDDILVCERGTVNQLFKFTNSGTKEQTFDVSIDSNWLYFINSKVVVPAKGIATVQLFGNVPEEFANLQTITAESAVGKLFRTANVVTLSKEECHDINYLVQPVVDANCCDGTIIPLYVGNNGYFEEYMQVKVTAPPWVTVSDTNVHFLPNQVNLIYVYTSPPAGADGNYTATIRVTNSAEVSRDINFVVSVKGNNCGPAVGADVDVNHTVADSQEFTRQEVIVDFVLTNDSNVGFNVDDIFVSGYVSIVDFNRGIFLNVGEKLDAKITVKFSEGEVAKDQNVMVTIRTSVGDFNKIQFLKFSDSGAQGVSVTGLFSAFTMPIIGLLLLILLVLVVLALRSTTAKKPKLRK